MENAEEEIREYGLNEVINLQGGPLVKENREKLSENPIVFYD